MGLHKTWIVDTIVCGMYSYTTVALLHENGENKTRVNAAGCGDGLNSVVDIVDLVRGIILCAEIGAGTGHGRLVRVEHLIVGCDPVIDGWPSSSDRSIATKESVSGRGTSL